MAVTKNVNKAMTITANELIDLLKGLEPRVVLNHRAHFQKNTLLTFFSARSTFFLLEQSKASSFCFVDEYHDKKAGVKQARLTLKSGIITHELMIPIKDEKLIITEAIKTNITKIFNEHVNQIGAEHTKTGEVWNPNSVASWQQKFVRYTKVVTRYHCPLHAEFITNDLIPKIRKPVNIDQDTLTNALNELGNQPTCINNFPKRQANYIIENLLEKTRKPVNINENALAGALEKFSNTPNLSPINKAKSIIEDLKKNENKAIDIDAKALVEILEKIGREDNLSLKEKKDCAHYTVSMLLSKINVTDTHLSELKKIVDAKGNLAYLREERHGWRKGQHGNTKTWRSIAKDIKHHVINSEQETREAVQILKKHRHRIHLPFSKTKAIRFFIHHVPTRPLAKAEAPTINVAKGA